MENSRFDAIGLLLALIAAILVFSAAQMSFGFLSSLSGLTILLVLAAFDRPYRSGVQSLAFGAVCGACCLLLDGYLFQLLIEPKLTQTGFDQWLSILWLAETFIFFGIDRARAGSVEQAPAGSTGQGFIPQSAPPPTYAPAPAYVPPAPPPAPVATYVPPPAPPPPPPPQSVFRQPEPIVPDYAPPPPLIEPIDPPVAAPLPQPAPPAPHVIPPGKEVMIYVNLVGEAMNMLRAVRSEHLGRDFYLIADEMPENETWEFKPGQVVRCKKKNLSSGKGLVAFEEAPRA